MDIESLNQTLLNKLCLELEKANSYKGLQAEAYREKLKDTDLYNLRELASLLSGLVADSRIESAIRKLALAFLEEFSTDAVADAVGNYWFHTRNRELGELVKKRKLVAHNELFKVTLLTILQTEDYDNWAATSGFYLIEDALEIIKSKKETNFKPKAIEWLNHIAPKHGNIICRLWLQDKSPLLLQILEKINHQPDIASTRFWLAFYLRSRDEVITAGDAKMIERLLKSCLSNEKPIAERAYQLLGKITDPHNQDQVCREFILTGHLAAQQIAVAQGWQPLNSPHRELFLLLTEQWDNYDKLDFDRRIMQTIYQKADTTLRHKIAAAIRVSGRTDYLPILTGGAEQTRQKDLTGEEAAILFETLAKQAEWQQLWQLVPTLPLTQSVAIIQQLRKNRWQPQTAEAQIKFAELLELAAQLDRVVWEDLEKKQFPEPLIQQIKTHLLLGEQKSKNVRESEKIKDMAFAVRRPLLALAVTQNRLVLWNTQTATVEQLIYAKPEKSVAFVIFTKSDILCWAERSAGNIPCRIYRWLEGSYEEIGQHDRPITHLVAYQDDQVISAGQDGQVILWDVRQKKKLSSYSLAQAPTDWPRRLVVSHAGKHLAVLHENLTILALPKLKLLTENSFGKFTKLQKGIFSPDDKSLLFFKKEAYTRYSRKLENWYFETILTEQPQFAQQGYHYIPEAITIPELDLVLTATDSGQLYFLDWLNQKINLSVASLPKKLTEKGLQNYTTLLKAALGFSYIALTDVDGQISIYDLRLLVLQQVFTQPLAAVSHKHFEAFRRLRDEYLTAELAIILRYIEAAISFRLRHEIEIEEEILLIQPGIFDIEVE